MKKLMTLALALAVATLFAAGCSNGGAEDKAPEKANKLASLCEKMVEAQNAETGVKLDEEQKAKAEDGCLVGYELYKDQPEAINALVGHIEEKCAEKTDPKEWYKCFQDESVEAAKKASELMKPE